MNLLYIFRILKNKDHICKHTVWLFHAYTYNHLQQMEENEYHAINNTTQK